MVDRFADLSPRAQWFMENLDVFDLAEIAAASEKNDAAIARVRAIAEELAAHGATWDGNEQGAGRRILNALKHRKEPK